MDIINYRQHLNRVLHNADRFLIKLFPDIYHRSADEVRTKDLRLSPERYEYCIRVYNHLDMSDVVDQFADLRLDPDFAFTLKDILHTLTLEQKTDYLNVVNDLITGIIKLDTFLDKATFYTQDFDVTTVADSQTGFFNIIAWIDGIRSWLGDILPILTACLPLPNVDGNTSSATEESTVDTVVGEIIKEEQDNQNSKSTDSLETGEESIIYLSHPEIAILYHLNEILINDSNAKRIAAKYGWKSQTSGKKLKQTYDELEHENQRTCKGKKRVENYMNIINLVDDKHKSLAYKELAKAKYNNRK